MTYHVPRDIWDKRIESIAATLHDAESLPPLIVKWQGDVLSFATVATGTEQWS